MFIDIDCFKLINDIYGYYEGDQLFKEFVYRVCQCLCFGDILVCQGGDEFIVLLLDVISIEDVVIIVKKMLGEFK